MLTLAMFLPISKPRDFECRGDLLLQCVVGRFAFLDDPVGAEITARLIDGRRMEQGDGAGLSLHGY